MRTTLPICVLLGATLTGCAARQEEGGPEWLPQLEAAHRTADQASARSDFAEARRALTEAIALRPSQAMTAGERRVLTQDLHYRLAEVELASGQPLEAQRAASRGLALGRHDDLFTANLLVVRGRALEATGAERESATDYYEALRINDRLLRQELGENP